MLQLGMSLSGWMVGMLVMPGKGMVATVGHIGLVVGGPGLGPARSVQGPESTLASTSNAHRRKKERKEGDFCLKVIIRLVHLKKRSKVLEKRKKKPDSPSKDCYPPCRPTFRCFNWRNF